MKFVICNDNQFDNTVEWRLEKFDAGVFMQCRQMGTTGWWNVFVVNEKTGKGICSRGLHADLGLQIDADGRLQLTN
jgi:hypothetical protein